MGGSSYACFVGAQPEPSGSSGTQLDGAVMTLWRRQLQLVGALMVAAGAVAGVVLGRTSLLPTGGAAVAVVGVAVIVSSIWLPGMRYRRWRYALGTDALHITHGAVIHHQSLLPYFRVQHVDVSSGPLERSLGLARIKVRTASSQTDGEIPGLARPVAEEMRDQLLVRAGSTPGL